MLYPINLLLRRLALPALAIVLGASLFVDRAQVMVQDDHCRSFAGDLAGNDPSATADIVICRDGNTYEATLTIRGESGFSVAHLEGYQACDGSYHFADMGPLISQPQDGWVFCFDDVYTLRWNPHTQRLQGAYTSEECSDAGTVRLRAR